jgi:hypothetical protein
VWGKLFQNVTRSVLIHHEFVAGWTAWAKMKNRAIFIYVTLHCAGFHCLGHTEKKGQMRHSILGLVNVFNTSSALRILLAEERIPPAHHNGKQTFSTCRDRIMDHKKKGYKTRMF